MICRERLVDATQRLHMARAPLAQLPCAPGSWRPVEHVVLPAEGRVEQDEVRVRVRHEVGAHRQHEEAA